jgi:hypothetical protein
MAIEQARHRLLADHDGEWVISDGRAFVFGDTLAGALKAARESGWALDVVAVERITRTRPPILL